MGVARVVEIVVGVDEADLASGLLWEAGVAAVAEEPASERTVRLRADVPAGGRAAVAAALGGRWPFVLTEIDDGWEGWRAHAEVVAVGASVVVRPPWVPLGPVADDVIVIEIDPARTFGHGAHPTTRLCLAEVEQALTDCPGASVLDVGCGSGVIAVAAAALGARRIVAVDVDPSAVDATVDNAAANGVADRLTVSTAPVAEVEGSHEVVVANIGAATLIALAADLRARVASPGRLIVSGLLADQVDGVTDALDPLVVRSSVERDGWWVVTLDA